MSHPQSNAGEAVIDVEYEQPVQPAVCSTRHA